MDFIFQQEQIIDHLSEYMVFYLIGVPLAIAAIYFTRPYSVSLIMYSLEIAIYLASMHTILHFCVQFFTWFSHETQFQAIGDRGTGGDWETPWLRFWEWEVYHPQWLIYLEVALIVIILFLVRRYRPMTVQRKQKISVKAAGPQKKKKGKGDDDDDDGWGVSTKREFEVPEDFVQKGRK